MYKCSSCSKVLSGRFTAKDPSFTPRTLFSVDWITIVYLCDGCANMDCLPQIKSNLKKWGLKDGPSVQFGDIIPIDQVAREASNHKCRCCGDSLGDKIHLEGLNAFIPEHRGIFENIHG